MTRPDNNPHPGAFTTGVEWTLDEPRARPLPVSGSSVDAHEREAELMKGLAQRRYDLAHSDEIDRRLKWEELYEMFRSYKVSKVKATEWADTITRRGVRRQ